MASVRKVTFHLLESMASPKIKGSVTVTLGSKSTKTSILQAVAYLLGKSSLGFVDKQGRRVNFDSTLSQSDCYVTEYAFYTPSGATSKHAYVYSNTDEDIKAGDIVSVSGEGEYVVLSGNGGYAYNPQVKVRSLAQHSDSIVSAANLTLIRRDEDEANVEDGTTSLLVHQLNEEFRNVGIQ